MDLPSAKELKKLADACRKAGIKSFKGGGIEFELADEAPQSAYKKAKAFHQDTGEIETDDLSPEDLLFYSVGGASLLGQKDKSE